MREDARVRQRWRFGIGHHGTGIPPEAFFQQRFKTAGEELWLSDGFAGADESDDHAMLVLPLQPSGDAVFFLGTEAATPGDLVLIIGAELDLIRRGQLSGVTKAHGGEPVLDALAG
jgi:hypothetical protein